MLSPPPTHTHTLPALRSLIAGPYLGPRKKSTVVNSKQDSWMQNHRGRGMIINDISSQIRHSWPLAAIPTNTSSGFGVEIYIPRHV